MNWRTLFVRTLRFILIATLAGALSGALLGSTLAGSWLGGVGWGMGAGFLLGTLALLGTVRAAEALLWHGTAQRAGELYYHNKWLQ